MTLILDLSSKVAEQQAEIERLAEQVRGARERNRAADTARTSSNADSEVPECPPRNFSARRGSAGTDAGCSRRNSAETHLSSPAHHDAVDDCRDRPASEESTAGFRFEGRGKFIRSTTTVSGAASGKSGFHLGRIPQRPVDSCRTSSAEQQQQQQTTGRYRAHWASSCFDEHDLVSNNDG